MSVSGPANYEDLRIDTRSLASALWRKKLRIVLVSALLCLVAWLYLSTLTPQYEATASLLVESRDNSFTRATNDPIGVGGAADPAAVQSQIQLVQAREALLLVIEAENLREVPELNRQPAGLFDQLMTLVGARSAPPARFVSDDLLIEKLRDRIIVARERDSRVFSVTFRAEDPELATRVANALARAHVQRRGDLLLEDTSDATVWLEREIEGLRGRVSEAEARVANYRVDNDLFAGDGDRSLLQQEMSDVTSQISAASERRNTVQTQARLIRGLVDAGQPVESIAEVRESPVVQQLAQQKAGLQSQRAERAATLLAGHPSIRALDAQIAELTAEIQAEGRRIADAFESQAAIEADLDRSLRDELTRLKIRASSAQINGVTLAELEREAAAQRDLLNAFLIRYREAAARTSSDAALPDVRIVSSAAQPGQPVYPQKNLLAAAVGMVAFVLQAGAVVLGELASGTVFVPRGRREDEEAMPRERRRTSAPPQEKVHGRRAEQAMPAEPEPDPVLEPEPELLPVTAAEPEPVEEPADDDDRAEPMVAAPTHAPGDEPPDWVEQDASHVAEPQPEAEPATRKAGSNRPVSGPIAALAALASGDPAVTRPEPDDEPASDIDIQSVERVFGSGVPAVPMSEHHTDHLDEGSAISGRSVSEPNEPEGSGGAEQSGMPDEPAHTEVEVAADEAGASRLEGAASTDNEDEFDVKWDEASEALVPEPQAEPEPQSRTTPELKSQFGKSTQHIAMHIAANSLRLSVVATADDSREDRMVAGRIAMDLIEKGLSVALVDAGGADRETEGPGLTELAAGFADFGDVVHHVDDPGLYHVPWGRQPYLDLDSPRIPMLLEALGELHDHILILCGPMADGSAIWHFARSGGALVLASKAETTVEQIARLSNQARDAGFEQVSLARADSASSDVSSATA